MMRGDLFAGRYRLQAVLGDGGFKQVWHAHDERLGRDVALSTFHLGSDATAARTELLREARALAALNHPNIVTVYDQGEFDGVPFLVTELMTRGDLSAHLARQPAGRIAPDTVTRLALDVLSGLDYAHAAGVIHRDVKPKNIWLDKDGNAVLGDFGIAAGGAADHASSLRNATGTIPYMAPEILNRHPASPKSDLYSLGCTLYEMVTGAPPFRGEMGAIIVQHLTVEPVAPSRIVSGIPANLDAAILDLLRKDPAERPPPATIRDLLLGHASVSATSRSTRRPSSTATVKDEAPIYAHVPPRRPGAARLGGFLAGLVLFGLLLVAGIAYATRGDGEPEVVAANVTQTASGVSASATDPGKGDAGASTNAASVQQTPTPTATPTPTPVRTPPPTPTPSPPLPPAPTPAGLGAVFTNGNFALMLVDVKWGGEYDEGGKTWKPAVRFEMKYSYTGEGQSILRFSKADFRLTDDVGTKYQLTGKVGTTICFLGCAEQDQPLSAVIDSNGSGFFTVPFGDGLSTLAPRARVLILTAQNFGNRIPVAEWRVRIP